MDFVVATVLFPALMVVLALGAGLLVDRATPGILPGVLIPAVGLALLVVVAELFAYREPTASLAPAAVAVVGVGGWALGWRRLRGVRLDWWPAAAAFAVYVMTLAPILLAGRVSMAGYLLDTTAAFHLAGADYLTAHARNFSELPESAFRNMMDNYFGNQYPSGGHTLLGATGRLIGTPRIWLYQPFLSLLVTACVPSLYYLARRAELARPVAAAAALLAATPALVYAYVQMGALKEITVLPFILLLGPLLVLLPRLLASGLRGVVPAAVVAAAGLGAIGVAFGPWLAAIGVASVALILLAKRDVRALRPLVPWTAVFVIALVVLAIPTIGPLSDSVSQAKSLSTSNAAAVADPGNLLRPLLGSQAAGIWLGGSHRVDPAGRVDETFLLIGLVAITALFGILYLVRRRMWDVLAFAISLGVVWAALTYRGTTWTDAKLLVLSSPIVVLLAAIGVQSFLAGRRRVEGVALGAVIAFGILASNAFTYHDTNLAPTDRYRELMRIGERFAGTAPTLTPDFDEFDFYALPEMGADGPGNAQRTERIARLRDGNLTAYGHTYDVDQLAVEAVEAYPLIVVRRKPEASRPPANFELAFRGRFYDVWRRGRSPEVLNHTPAGVGLDPASTVTCASARRLGSRARAEGARLAYVTRPELVPLDVRRARLRPTGWADIPEGIGLYSPGRLEMRFRVPTDGRYRIWLKGDIARRLTVSVDGEEIGSAAYETGGEGNYAQPLTASLTAGAHRFAVVRGGGSLRPGDGTPGRLIAVVFEPLDQRPQLRVVAPNRWRAACAQPVDWLEIVRPG